MKKIGILLALSLMLFTGCNVLVSPKVYQEEIEDVVKFNIAVLQMMSDTYSENEKEAETSSWFWGGELTSYAFDYWWENYCDKIDSFETSINELWNQTEDEAGYHTVLVQVSQDTTNKWNKMAKKTLERYEVISVIISEYQKVETASDIKLWKFQELNTGLIGTFFADSDNNWYCELTESSMERFLRKSIQ